MALESADTTVCDPMIGQTLADRFEIQERLGYGLKSVVYRALQWPLRRSVAVKVLSGAAAADQRMVRRFINEGRMLARLRHPHTVSLIDFGRLDDGRLFMVTEYVNGGNLGTLMEQGRLAIPTALRIAQQIARALAEVHAHGIIHRDLKPENVMLDRVRGERLVVRLIDFGLAKGNPEHGDAEVTKPRARIGTPGYMAPEQAFFRPVDSTADLYALGVILYEMLTGHPVFEAECKTSLHLEHQYSEPFELDEMCHSFAAYPGLSALVGWLLAKDPSQRPGSAQPVVKALDELIARSSEPGEVATESIPRPTRQAAVDLPLASGPQSRRHLLTGIALGAGAVVLLAALFAF